MAACFMQTVCPMVVVASKDQDFIFNMDQPPIPFTFDRQRTLELVGAHTYQQIDCDTKRATLAGTITTLGRILTPVLVFKGAP